MATKHHHADSFIAAKNYTPAPGRRIRLIVIHSMESSRTSNTAENVASWFAGPSAPMASAHFCIDSDSIVQGVDVKDVAWAAPGANNDGIQIELAGRASQSRAEWMDEYGKQMLTHTTKLVASLCQQYGIPAQVLSAADVLAGRAGIVSHDTISKAYKKSNHWDPGTGFPWDWFLRQVRGAMNAAPAPGQKAPWTVRIPGRVIARGSLNHATVITRISAALRDKGYTAPWYANTIHPVTNKTANLGVGRLWPLTAFKKKVSQALQDGYTVKLNDYVTIRKEA